MSRETTRRTNGRQKRGGGTPPARLSALLTTMLFHCRTSYSVSASSVEMYPTRGTSDAAATASVSRADERMRFVAASATAAVADENTLRAANGGKPGLTRAACNPLVTVARTTTATPERIVIYRISRARIGPQGQSLRLSLPLSSSYMASGTSAFGGVGQCYRFWLGFTQCRVSGRAVIHTRTRAFLLL